MMFCLRLVNRHNRLKTLSQALNVLGGNCKAGRKEVFFRISLPAPPALLQGVLRKLRTTSAAPNADVVAIRSIVTTNGVAVKIRTSSTTIYKYPASLETRGISLNRIAGKGCN
jgi:hypothetical protein